MTTKLRVLFSSAIVLFVGLAIIELTSTSVVESESNAKPSAAETKSVAPPPNGVFPTVEIAKYTQRASGTRGAVVILRIRNRGTKPTDPISLTIKDKNSLMRQSKPINIPSVRPGASQVFQVNLESDVTAGHTPGDIAAWTQRFEATCGPMFLSVMSVRGRPENAHAQGPGVQLEKNLPVVATATEFTQVDAYASICADGQCVKPCLMAQFIKNQLDNHVVGYSFFVGLNSNYKSHGSARTSADGTVQSFTPNTKITVASVSKLVTAIAAVRILDKNGVGLDDPIGPYLPPDWDVSNYVENITFAQLLSQTSGIKDYGNVTTDLAKLKDFFSQPITRGNSQTACTVASVVDPPHAINPNDNGRCYSNYNFSIFRILLPRVAKLKKAKAAHIFARQYVRLVQENVFDRVGQMNVKCMPPTNQPDSSTYAFAYKFPGSTAGADWGDESLKCGAQGWYLSVKDIAKVLLSINARDGKILAEAGGMHQFEDMRTRWLGWDTRLDTELQKDGGYGSCDGAGNCAEISTSVAIFGPVTGPRLVAVLFMNSNISGGVADGEGAHGVLRRAYNNSHTPEP